MFRHRAKPGAVVFSSLLAGSCLAAYAIFIHGVQMSAVTKALIVILIVFVSIAIPAALLLMLCKLLAFAYRKIREKE